MQEIIYQRVPGGCLTPEEQVVLAFEMVRGAANLLEFSGLDELETALATMHKPLVLLAAAGLLAEITFSLTDPQGNCGAVATIVPYDVADYEEVDLSRLRLLANPEALGSIEVGCVECAFASEITGTEWLPEATDVLSCSLVSRSDTDEQMEYEEEKRDGDDEYQSWRESDGKDSDLYD